MEKSSKVFVGMDVHKREVVVAILEGWSKAPKELRFRNDSKSVNRFARKLKRDYGDRLSCVYEAGPCGYTLKRQMGKVGVPVDIAMPTS